MGCYEEDDRFLHNHAIYTRKGEPATGYPLLRFAFVNESSQDFQYFYDGVLEMKIAGECTAVCAPAAEPMPKMGSCRLLKEVEKGKCISVEFEYPG